MSQVDFPPVITHFPPCGPAANQEPSASVLAAAAVEALEHAAAGQLPRQDTLETAASGKFPELGGLMRLLDEDEADSWTGLVDAHVPDIPSADLPSGSSGGYSGVHPGSGGYFGVPAGCRGDSGVLCWRCAAMQRDCWPVPLE